MTRKLVLLQNILISLFLITGCSTSFSRIEGAKIEDQISENNDDVMDRGPVKGGNIKLLSTTPDNLNPLLTKNIYVRDFLGMIYESLVQIDKKLNAYPQLSDRWEVSDDGFTWTFFLRKDVTWQDTVPFTAEDVEFTCDTIMKLSAEDCAYKINLKNISAFSAVDKYTFKLILKNPNSFTPELMTFPIIPKHYFGEQDIKVSEGNMKPVGTGPYKFLYYNENSIKLLFNDKWWNGKSRDSTLPSFPYIAEIDVQVLGSDNDTIDTFHTSGIDTAYISTADYIKYGGRQDITIKKYTGRYYEYLAFNLKEPAMSDKAVRQAIAHSISRAELINDILPGQATISDIPATPGTWINDSNGDFYPPNKEKAKELLINNGWRQSSYGLYKYINGVYSDLRIELLVNSDDSKRVRVAEYVVNQLNETGFNVKLKKVDWNTLKKLLAAKTYDIALLGCYAPVVPDLSFMYASWSNTGAGDSAYNVSGFSNALADGYIGQVITEKDSNERKRAFEKFKEVVMDELPYYGLYFYNEAMLYNKRVKGEINPYMSNKYYDITKWYLP